MAGIQVIQGPDKGKKIELSPKNDNYIGRDACDLTLADRTVSRKHSRLSIISGQWMLEDLGAANGTYLNGVKISKPMAVNPGDQIRCGTTLLVFGGQTTQSTVDVDESGNIVEASIVATMPSNQDSVIIPTPEAGSEAIAVLRIIYQLISDISSIFDVDMLLKRTLDKVLEVIKADRGYIMLIDDKGKLILKASRVVNGKDQKVPISRTIINEVVAKQVGVLSSDAMTDKRFNSGKSVHNLAIRSAVCAPIKGRQRILGVIHLDSAVAEQTYSTEQLRLLTAIGYQAGLAVENVRLFEQGLKSERMAAIGETVANLSHHIKNIIQALNAGTDLVEGAISQNDADKAKRAWPIVQRNLDRINQLILNMLTYSKPRKPNLELMNVNHTIEDCIELERAKAEQLGIAIITDLDDMPPIPADPDGMNQIFLNLIGNAIEAVQEKVGVVTVTTRFNQTARCVTVQVHDNGKGIDADNPADIFLPFWSTKGHKGTGLGLAVARKVVEEHQGTINVSSEKGKGTTFVVSLPAGDMGASGETMIT